MSNISTKKDVNPKKENDKYIPRLDYSGLIGHLNFSDWSILEIILFYISCTSGLTNEKNVDGNATDIATAKKWMTPVLIAADYNIKHLLELVEILDEEMRERQSPPEYDYDVECGKCSRTHDFYASCKEDCDNCHGAHSVDGDCDLGGDSKDNYPSEDSVGEEENKNVREFTINDTMSQLLNRLEKIKIESYSGETFKSIRENQIEGNADAII